MNDFQEQIDVIKVPVSAIQQKIKSWRDMFNLLNQSCKRC